jgi:hypothetical protein
MAGSGCDPWPADGCSDREKHYSQNIPAPAPVGSEYINMVFLPWWWISDKLICKLLQSSSEALAFHEWKGHL